MDDISKKFLESGTCPHCYKHILEVVDKDDKAKWITVKCADGILNPIFYLPDLVDRKNIPNGNDYGSISSPSIIPEELPDDFMWVCTSCYTKIRNENNKKNKDKSDDERWIDFLDDWQ